MSHTKKLVYATVMLSEITNYFHILKARVVVAYALFYASSIGRGICRPLMKNTSFLTRHPFVCLKNGFPQKIKFKHVYANVKETYSFFYRGFFKTYVAHRKTSLADYVYVEIEELSLSYYFETVVGVAWLCEKLGINVKFTFPDTYGTGSSNFFESSVLDYAKTCHLENFTQLKKPLNIRSHDSPWFSYSKSRIPKEYGHKIITKLSIKQEIQQQADQWRNENIEEECAGVHYRQTDAIHEPRVISIDGYIDYLKQVLDNHYQIYACSDNVKFIEAIHKEFPGRVVSRDITRSQSDQSLHRHEPYVGHQQRQDALIDMLILAKCEVIYTVGSLFIDTVRFFNPTIKIISLDKQDAHKKIPNYLPIPRMDLVQKARADTGWKKLLSFNNPVDVRYQKK